MGPESPKKFGSRDEQYRALIEQHDDAHVLDNLQNLGISEADLIGKKTLDIGAGGGEFARWANRNGGDVTPIGLGLERKDVKRLEVTDTGYVIGDATALPFTDGTFDFVLSHAAIPNVVAIGSDEVIPRDKIVEERHKRVNAAIHEAIRVLKPGGEIRLAPVIRNEKNGPRGRTESIEQVLEELKNDPALEVKEELLEKDEEGGGGIVRDTYRIIIYKKLTLDHDFS